MRIKIYASVRYGEQAQQGQGTHHSNEQSGLLRSPSHTGVTDDANRETRSKTRQTHRQPSAQVDEALRERHRCFHYMYTQVQFLSDT